MNEWMPATGTVEQGLRSGQGAATPPARVCPFTYGVQRFPPCDFTVALGEVEGTSSFLDPRRRAARKRIARTFASPRPYAPPNLG